MTVRPPDPDELAERATSAAQAWCHGCSVNSLTPLPGGLSGLTYAAEVAGGAVRRLVLKVAPAGVEPVRSRDVLRQARVIQALAPVTDFRVPRVLFRDHGAAPELPPFFAMTFVRGSAFEPHNDLHEHPPSRDQIAHRARHAARLLAVLHRLSLADLDLADEPALSVGEELDRWCRTFATVDERDDARVGSIAERLAATVPSDLHPCLVHGDYRLGNMLCVGGEVRAVIDWEIWGHGDPRVDLAWFLLTADAANHPAAVRTCPTMPDPDDLLAEYERAGGRAVVDLRWFTALALFKMASTTALIAKHQRRHGELAAAHKTAALVPSMLDTALREL